MLGGRRTVLALATLAAAFCTVAAGAHPASAIPARGSAPGDRAASARRAVPAATAVFPADPGRRSVPDDRTNSSGLVAPEGDGPAPVSAVLQIADSDEQRWVRLRWRTDRQVCDFKLEVWGNRSVDVDYPASRDYTSLSRGDTLRPGHTDYTSFRVTPHYDRSVWALLTATITYDHCGRHSPTVSRSTGLLLPVRG